MSVRPHLCPSCKRPIEWSPAFPQRPFCSERCRLIDLGAWFTGERAIPGERIEDAADLDAEADATRARQRRNPEDDTEAS